MQVDTSDGAMGLHVPMLSPPFDVSKNQCLSFDYKVWVPQYIPENWPPPRLDVYISASSHVFSGWKVWGSNGTGEGHVQIPVQAEPDATFRISFVGVIGDPATTLINVANVALNSGHCESTDCNQTVCDAKTAEYYSNGEYKNN